jgi:hypothetical protein
VVEDQDQYKNPDHSNEAMEQAIKPKQSYWPIVLAASLTLTLLGVVLMTYPILDVLSNRLLGWSSTRNRFIYRLGNRTPLSKCTAHYSVPPFNAR